MQKDTLYICEHIFMCLTPRYCVFLDAARDKYLTVPRSDMERLCAQIAGWTECYGAPAAHTSRGTDTDTKLSESLASSGLFRRGGPGARKLECIDLPEPEATIFSASAWHSPFQKRFLAHFLYATCMADWQLRRRSFKSVIERAIRRRQLAAHMPFPIERARKLIFAFASLRLLYPRPYLCLFDSLALLEFMRLFGLAPRWVFGVTPEPFEAHCWLQAGETILNDTLERVSIHYPIMAV